LRTEHPLQDAFAERWLVLHVDHQCPQDGRGVRVGELLDCCPEHLAEIGGEVAGVGSSISACSASSASRITAPFDGHQR
jgi:hypothetical protein